MCQKFHDSRTNLLNNLHKSENLPLLTNGIQNNKIYSRQLFCEQLFQTLVVLKNIKNNIIILFIQETLLELKTRNYTLEDQAKKQRSALGEATARVTVLQQELTKAKKAIEKSKKISEVQNILTENENLQRKLMSQEDDFRLQNQTLLNELTIVSIGMP